MNSASEIWGDILPSLVIFDLDGTLVDSIEGLTASINVMRDEFSLNPLETEAVRQAIGKGARHLVTRCMPENDCRIDDALALFLKHNETNIAVHSRLYPGVTELLSALTSRDIALAVVTNKNTAHSTLLLSGLGIADFFINILGGDCLPCCKPFPEPLWEAIKRAGADVSSTFMIGDSVNDFDAANAAGVRSVGCNYGYGEEWELERATVRIDSLNDLLPLPFR